MSARQDKYIAQLLRAHHDKVLAYYREARAEVYTWQHTQHHDNGCAQRMLRDARDRVLLDIAKARNVAHVQWEPEEDAYDYGDCLTERQVERQEAKLASGEASVEVMTVYVRDRAAKWDVSDCLGMVWVDKDDDRRDAECEHIGMAPVRLALYRHRDRDTFRDFEEVYVPGHWAVR